MYTKLAIVDDNNFLIKVIQEKISFFEDLKVSFIAFNGEDALKKLEVNHNIDLILMDIDMPKKNGIQTTFEVKQKYPHIKIIMLTVLDDDENIFNAIKTGADGYFLKEINPKDLYNGIKETLNGGAAMTPSIAMKTIKLLRKTENISNKKDKERVSLTKRETEVLEQLCKGLSYSTIADNLIISIGTTKKHIENIYKKLQVHNKLEAVLKAKKNKLI